MKGKHYLVLIGWTIFLMSCNERKPSGNVLGREYLGSLFGKQFKIEVIGDSTDYQREIDQVLIGLQKQFSLVDSNSTLFKINYSKEIGNPILIEDPEHYFVQFYRLMEELHMQSNGRFDPSAISYERIAAFMTSDPDFEPNFTEFEGAVGFGPQTLELKEMGTSVSVIKHHRNVEWEVTDAVACWAMDLLVKKLQVHGFSAIKVTMSGKYLVWGEGPGDFNVCPMGFTGQMEDPQVRLKNRALCFKSAMNKKAYIDLKTKKLIENDFQWVSISAPSMLASEVFSKAFMCMNLDEVATWYEANANSDVQSFIIYGSQNKLDRAATQEFDKMIMVKPVAP